ncbi:hypothetical protein GDO86_000963 [Hymenochirus boettgeri]|uniref:ADAM10 endopeptidase n=1 Tax=Hymenochirus boettgeri TaxID=247094 RepID=A0A8T2KCY6_9PIPI|nr:hypothetical protein GDO86_000963 [Hymenochirus boettgeri]
MSRIEDCSWVKKRPFLNYYENISYDSQILHRKHQRSRRFTTGMEPISLDLFAYKRKFSLVLRRDLSSFTEDFQVVSSNQPFSTDTSFIYSGILKDEKESFCHGSVIDGHFEGFMQTKNGTYYVEYEKHQNGTADSFMYHENDINYSHMKDKRSIELTLQKYQFLEKMKWKKKEQDPVRSKRSLDLSRTTCLLYLKADYLFYKRFNSVERVISQISSYLAAVNTIYEKANFNGVKNIKFKVDQEVDSSNVMHSNFIGPEKLLMLHSESVWNNYCLSYLITDRDYNGVLGLAWNGRPGNSGGVCSKYSLFEENLEKQVSLNTGIVTIQKYGQYLPQRLIHITLAHEFGHSLGSPHDESQECASFDTSGDNGNYLMFPYATDGNQYNNDKFSPCSIHYIWNLLQVKKDRCFVESDQPSCGNQIVEDGEECDVGSNDADPCCYSAKSVLPCTLKPGKQCSPSQGLCCNHSCNYKSKGERCQDEGECTSENYCTGQTAKCPKPLPKSNYTLCNAGTRICLNGMCRESVCAKFGLEQCDCDSESMHEKCQLCCQQPGNVYSCKSTTSVELDNFFHKTAILLSPGSPCGHRQGYCDKFHICRLVDADGPIARLKKSFLNLIDAGDPASWMKANWWVILLIILAFAALMAGTVFIFGRTLDSEKAKKQNEEKRGKSSQRNSKVIYRKKEECVATEYFQYSHKL